MPRALRPGVLIVEDEEELLSLIARMFESEAYRIFRARDGGDAIELFTREQSAIQLVVTDLGLPGVGGADVITTVRSLKPDIKIVGVSGYGSKDVRALALAAGADLFCEKPFAVHELLDSVRKLMSTP